MNSPVYSPSSLFEDIQMQQIFPDGKTFVDCLPRFPEEEIHASYIQQKEQPGFSLQQFVITNFELPVSHSNNYQSDTGKTVAENINKLWDVLTRKPDKVGGSLIPLPHSYIVPGGRFGEIYYWDSYFTMLGLRVSGKHDMLENMVNNFSYLIDKVGYIPNGNRSYFIGRSQPPFYSLMVKLLAGIKGKDILLRYLPQLEKEYHFWIKGQDGINETTQALHRVMRLPGGEIMNRYWDENDTPRPESYREDVELAHGSGQAPGKIYRHLRAGAESGWDFSCRWFKEKDKFTSIHTTEIVPVDLNCLLLHLEETIAGAYRLAENDPDSNREAAKKYELLAEKRRQAIQKYCWSDELGFFVDYDFIEKKQKRSLTLAGLFPLTFKIATEEKAKQVAAIVKEKFLSPGGVVTTLQTTGQQWDAPNGWAPLQWMTITGLENYGHYELAAEIARRWINLNTDVFKRTGKLMEKYNVVDTHLEAGGGEYAGQDGFGWTNGVLLALIEKHGMSQ